jgi:four helix bundle protein
MKNKEKKYDLEERTAKFGEEIIKFCRTIKRDDITRPLINQLVRSGTSIGANYLEANGASSKKDFRNKIYICKKESQETRHWLRMIVAALPELINDTDILIQEAKELSMIFNKITSTIDNKV